MNYYINYILGLLSNSQMDEQTLISNLEKKFSLTESYCEDILSSMVDEKLIMSEFDEDFHNFYTITNLGLDRLNNITHEQEDDDDIKSDNIDYKTLLGDMYNNEDSDDEQDEIINAGSTFSSQDEDFKIDHTETESENNEAINAQQNQNNYNDDGVYLKDFSKYKINVKKHVKSVKYRAETKDYIRTSSLELFTSIALFVFFCIIEGISYLILSGGNNITYQVNLAYIIYTCVVALYPISCLIYYLTHPNRKDSNKFNFLQAFKLICLCVGIVILLILSLNFLFGLNKLNMIKYLSSWMFPILIGLTMIMYPIAKLMLIKTNKFNA